MKFKLEDSARTRQCLGTCWAGNGSWSFTITEYAYPKQPQVVIEEVLLLTSNQFSAKTDDGRRCEGKLDPKKSEWTVTVLKRPPKK